MAFIGTFCSPCARCKVELFIKYLHTSLISHSIKTPACSTTEQAGFSFFFYPRYYRAFCSVHCAAYHAAFSLSIASVFNSDIGSADICPRCYVLASSVREIDSSHLFDIHFYSLDIIRCSVVVDVETTVAENLYSLSLGEGWGEVFGCSGG